MNNKPIPPTGLVINHLGNLTYVPEHFSRHLDAILLNSNEMKIESALYFMRWAISKLENKIMENEERALKAKTSPGTDA